MPGSLSEAGVFGVCEHWVHGRTSYQLSTRSVCEACNLLEVEDLEARKERKWGTK